MTLIAHISDLHVCKTRYYMTDLLLQPLNPVPGPWTVTRPATATIALPGCEYYSTRVVKSLVQDLNRQRVQAVVVTGDFTLGAKKREFAKASEYLRELRARVLGVPGNHDYWTRRAWKQGRFHEHLGWTCPAGETPWVHDSPGLRVIGVDSCSYTPNPLNARGRLGARQLAFVREHAKRRRRGQRVALALHHHVLPGNSDQRIYKIYLHQMLLEDSEALWQTACKAGVDIILHGHLHTPFRVTCSGGPTVICAGSGGVKPRRRSRASACYNLVSVPRRGAPRVRTRVHNGDRWTAG